MSRDNVAHQSATRSSVIPCWLKGIRHDVDGRGRADGEGQPVLPPPPAVSPHETGNAPISTAAAATRTDHPPLPRTDPLVSPTFQSLPMPRDMVLPPVRRLAGMPCRTASSARGRPFSTASSLRSRRASSVDACERRLLATGVPAPQAVTSAFDSARISLPRVAAGPRTPRRVTPHCRSRPTEWARGPLTAARPEGEHSPSDATSVRAGSPGCRTATTGTVAGDDRGKRLHFWRSTWVGCFVGGLNAPG